MRLRLGRSLLRGLRGWLLLEWEMRDVIEGSRRMEICTVVVIFGLTSSGDG